MSEPCAFCGGPVNPHDEGTYKQVSGWVHGKRKDSMTLREDTGKYAHTGCVLKAKAGNAPDQPDLFGEDAVASGSSIMPGLSEDVLEEIFEKTVPPPTIQSLGKMLGLTKPVEDTGPDQSVF